MNIESTVEISGQRTFEVRRGGSPGRLPVAQRLRDIIRDALPNTDNAKVNAYRVLNLINIWRGFYRIAIARLFGIGHSYGALYAKVIRGDGTIENLGLISLRVITTVGVGYIVDAFQNSVELENQKYHAFGTGSTAEASGDTAMVTELTTEYASNIRPTGTTTEGASANIYRTVATLTPDSGGSIALREHGIFSANAAGVLFDRSVFAAVTLDSANGDSLQVTYETTFPAGS